MVSGVVQDQTGAVLPGAAVALVAAGAATPSATVTSDAAGLFRFERVVPGAYDIRSTFPGFTPNLAHVRVAARAPGPLTIVMEVEGFAQEVSVTSGGTTSTAAGANLDTISVDGSALDDLPILDQDVVTSLSRFLDSSAIGTAGTTIVVDGIEVNALSLSASAVQQIKINQDPYSAEYSRPGRGRIEIISKPGGKDYNGTLNFRFRDSAFYARNPFAATKPPQQRRIVEGTFGGPVPDTEKTSFMISGSYDAEDAQAAVYAETPSGTVQQNVPTPNRYELLAGTWNHQQTDATTMSVRLSHYYQKNTNQGVGGVTLPESGYNHTDREDEITYSHTTVFRPTLLNEVKLLVGFENEPRISINSLPRIVVQDSFTGGGAQNDSLRTEKHFTLVEAVTWSPKNQSIKFGLNVPDWSWRGFDDQTNSTGTFYFSSNADYAAGKPYSYVVQAGNGQVNFLEKVLGGFFQDEIRLRGNLSVTFGLRYDWQSYFHDDNNFAPRFSFAYSPDEKGRTVLRGGAGVFYDRTGPGPILDLLRYDGQHLNKYVLTDPGFPNPIPPGETLAAQPLSIVQLAPGATIPFLVQYGAGVERQLIPRTTLAIIFVGTRGVDAFRSLDVNQGLPPDYTVRPNPEYAIVRQIQSAGKTESQSLQFTLRGQITRFFNGSAEYTFGRAYNNTSGVGWMPPNSYDLSLEYARADYIARHRLEMFGTVPMSASMNLGVSVSLATGRPYSLTTGLDAFNEGVANARPDGVPRNSLTGPGYADVDLRWSREFVLSGPATPKPQGGGGKRTITVGVDAFNTLNHTNFNQFVGNLSSPFFGQATSAAPARRMQFSLRVRY